MFVARCTILGGTNGSGKSSIFDNSPELQIVGDFINADLLGSPNERMIGNVIQNLFTTTGDYAHAAALSVILMLIIVVLVMFYIRRAGTEELL